jgi:MFS family permease
VFSGALCIFACFGLGRFALGMLLPSMGRDLGLSYSQMGFIGTGNFLGYLVSVLLSGVLAARLGPRRLIFIALLVVGLSMALISRAGGFLPLMVLYFATGAGSGAANVPMMGLMSSWFSRNRRGMASGFVVSGSGLGIVLSGWLIPYVNGLYGQGGWRVNWLLLAALAVAAAFVCLRLIRNSPAEMGLSPAGSGASPPRSFDKSPSIYRHSVIHHLGAIYFLFGFTYVIYATFLVTSLVEERGMAEAAAGGIWSLVGLLSLVSGPVFGAFSDRFGRRAGLGVVFSFQMLAYLIAAMGLPGGFVYASVALYGLVAWSIPSIMAAAVGDHVGAGRAPEAFGFITFIFALGQVSGPAAAGVVAELTGSFSGSFFMAAAMAFAAILLTLFMRRPRAA